MRTRSSVAKQATPAEAHRPGLRDSAEPRGSASSAQECLDDRVADDQADRERRERSRAAEAPRTHQELRSRVDGLSMGRHARIVDHLFELPDPTEVYTRIRGSLSFGGRVSSMGYGDLADALDEAERNALDAVQLLANAKAAHDAFELDSKVIWGAMREQAVADLQAQKESGSRSKQITNDDIEAVMATKFPDEYRDLELKRGRARRTVAALEQLADISRDRARDLRAFVGKARGDA